MTVDLGDLGTSALVAALSAVGVTRRFELDDDFVARTRVLPLVHDATGMGVDVVLAGPGPETSFLARARVVRFDDVPIRIAAPTDMIVMKDIARRKKDMDDIVGILRSAPERLEIDQARAMLGELEEALGQSDLLPTLEQAKARAARR